jgi:acetyltransferase-like isoleucine patch superfamily enzyme
MSAARAAKTSIARCAPGRVLAALRSGVTSFADRARSLAGEVARASWDEFSKLAAIRSGSRRAGRFRSFGEHSVIAFPVTALFGEEYIDIGRACIFGPGLTLSAGVSPGHVIDPAPGVRIGNGVLLGKGSGIVAHHSVEIGDDVFTGHHVYITDANHGYEDLDESIGRQFAPPRPVTIGAASWLGHGTIVLPGAHIGRHVVIGAGSVVTGTIPDFSVAVGNPARVIRRHVMGEGWVSVRDGAAHAQTDAPDPGD